MGRRHFDRDAAIKAQDRLTEESGNSSNNFISIWKYDPDNPLPKLDFSLKEDKTARTMQLDIIPHEITPSHPQYKQKKAQSRDPEFVEDVISDIWVHKNVGPTNATVLCLDQYGKKCPLCEDYEKLKAELGWDHDDVKAAKKKCRGILTVVDRNDEEGKIQVVDRPHFWFAKKLLDSRKQFSNESRQIILYDVSDEGHFVETFTEISEYNGKKGPGANNSFFFQKRGEDTGYGDEIVDEAPKIGDWLIVRDYDELVRIRDGEDAEEEAEEEDRAEANAVAEKVEETVDIKKPEERKSRRPRKKKEEPKEDTCPYDLVFGQDSRSCETCDKCELEHPSIYAKCDAEYDAKWADEEDETVY